MRLYHFLQLQISVFFSSFTKAVISTTLWKKKKKTWPGIFFPSAFMESERKVVKPCASSYLAFQTPRWTWIRKMSQKRYNNDLEPCSSQCSGSPEETPLFRQENWWNKRSRWRNDKFCQTMSNNNWENLLCTKEK